MFGFVYNKADLNNIQLIGLTEWSFLTVLTIIYIDIMSEQNKMGDKRMFQGNLPLVFQRENVSSNIHKQPDSNNIVVKIPQMNSENHRMNEQNSENSEFVAQLNASIDHYDYDESPANKKLRKSEGGHQNFGKNNFGNWMQDEEKRFLEHMIAYEMIYRKKQLRRTNKIFKRMAKVVKSRSSNQCRSHHQKLQLKLKSYDGIIKYLQDKYNDQPAQESDDGIHYSPINIENLMSPSIPFRYKKAQGMDKHKNESLLNEQEYKFNKKLMGTFQGMQQKKQEDEKIWEVELQKGSSIRVKMNRQIFISDELIAEY